MANSEAKRVREQRKTASQREQQKKADQAMPVTVGAAEPSRRRFILGDPAEPRVVEHSGYVPDGTLSGYSVAPCDAVERIYPGRCQTPVARVRWRAGQRVPTAVLERWLADNPAPAAVTPESGEHAIVPPKPVAPPLAKQGAAETEPATGVPAE